MTQIISLSDRAAERIKEIMSKDQKSLGVRVGVKVEVVQEWPTLWNMLKKKNLMMK